MPGRAAEKARPGLPVNRVIVVNRAKRDRLVHRVTLADLAFPDKVDLAVLKVPQVKMLTTVPALPNDVSYFFNCF